MRGFSKAILAGNLTRDPEMRTTPSGATVCGFTIAVNRSFKDSSGKNQESVSFIDCNAWGKTGELINQYTHKGSAILVSGRLDQHSWTDKNDQKRSRVEVTVEDFAFIGGGDNKGGDSQYGGEKSGINMSAPVTPAGNDEVVPQDIPENDEITMEDLPF